MSRRSHHGRTTHSGRGQRGDNGRPAQGANRLPPGVEPRSHGTEPPPLPLSPLPASAHAQGGPVEHRPEQTQVHPIAVAAQAAPAPPADPPFRRTADQPPNGGHSPSNGGPDSRFDATTGCTAPQLRRFIKSRAYVPMHELRRRFGINGGEDDVTGVQLDGTWIYVGLPGREGSLLGDLMRGGEVGYELSLDPRTPVVIGVYPMRPVPRH
jgi:hypothetical protein